MAEVVLQLIGASCRHYISAPLLTKPWRKILGPGIAKIDLKLHKGAILGLVGPNGAGKTTLLRMLSGILPLQKGTIVSISQQGGQAVETEFTTSLELRKIIGHMPEQVRWQGKKSVLDAMIEIAAMRGSSEHRILGLIKLVGLNSRIDSPLDELSQGMRQRLTLAIALLGSPEILLLDEPFNGLDPVAGQAFAQLLRKLSEKGVSIVISSHQVSGLIGIIDRIALLHRGQLLIEGEIKSVEKELELSDRFDLTGTSSPPSSELIEKLGMEIIDSNIDNGVWQMQVKGNADGVLKNLISEGIDVESWQPHAPDLVEMLCSSTGLRVEDVGLEITSSAFLPLLQREVEEE
jgi:ABC-2 type transport system ATP-binding protein